MSDAERTPAEALLAEDNPGDVTLIEHHLEPARPLPSRRRR